MTDRKENTLTKEIFGKCSAISTIRMYVAEMYARNLLDLLHRQLAEIRDYAGTFQRFESLRGCGMLPRGRDNANRRLEDAQIANAVLGFVPSLPGWAGHVSLVLGNLSPVGGANASFRAAPDLRGALANLVGTPDACDKVIKVTLSIIRKTNDDEYFAQIRFVEDGARRTASYVSKNALSLFSDGAEAKFDGERQLTPTARQLVLGQDFFRKLHRSVSLSRTLDEPFKPDWREYENEEQRQDFHSRMGARRESSFLNLGVDTHVTWPKEPTRLSFEGHHLVLFPKTNDNSHSISVDLANEHLNIEQARTLINRFLSLLSWCDNQHAILREGWSGNPVPVPVPKRDMAFATAHHWAFHRSIPQDEQLLRCLAYYREGLNASEAGIIAFEVLSFYKVFEVRYATRAPVKQWVASIFEDACRDVIPDAMKRFHEDRGEVTTEEYIYRNCRVATAHAAQDVPSDVDASPEISRLWNAAPILRALARHFIRTEFQFSESYFTDSFSEQ